MLLIDDERYVARTRLMTNTSLNVISFGRTIADEFELVHPDAVRAH
jgi:hypothetical protein